MGNFLGGGFLSATAQMFPPAPKWTSKDMPDMSGKVALVTGGNTGVGKETVKALLEHNAKVYLAARSKDRAMKAIEDLKQATGKEAIFLQLDLGNMAAVRTSAEEFLSKEPELHVLFNNAGVMIPPVEQTTSDGFDLQFGTNVVGHWLFTQSVLPALLRAAENASDRKARVITTSSCVAYLISSMDFNTFKDGPARRKMSPRFLYAQSKFGNKVVAWELCRRYADQGIVSIAVNPGNLDSELMRHTPPIQLRILKLILRPVWMGALTQLYAGTMPDAVQMNGKWMIPWAQPGIPNRKTLDPEVGKKLWTWLEENTKA